MQASTPAHGKLLPFPTDHIRQVVANFFPPPTRATFSSDEWDAGKTAPIDAEETAISGFAARVSSSRRNATLDT